MALETITIFGRPFNIPVPARYDAGSQITLDEGESNSIAQTFCENVRNNMAGKMKKREGASNGEEALPEALMAEWQQKIDEYASTYKFGIRAVGGGRISYDPETREALALIRPDIRKALVKRFGAKHGRTPEQVTEAALRLLESPKGERYRRLAKQIVRQKQDAAEGLLDGLDQTAE